MIDNIGQAANEAVHPMLLLLMMMYDDGQAASKAIHPMLLLLIYDD